MTNRRKILTGFVFILVIVLLFTPVTLNQLKVGDYPPHLNWAQQLGKDGYLYLRANILFQRAVLVVRDILPFNFLARLSPLFKQIIDIKSYDISAYIVTIISLIVTSCLSFYYLADQTNFYGGKKPLTLLIISAIVLQVVGPITLFTLPERQYFGYWTGNPFHNPTYILMKPFSLMVFIIISHAFVKVPSSKSMLLSLGALLFSTLAKPNFTLSFVPAIFVVLFLFQRKHTAALWKTAFFLLLSTVIILSIQYYIMYTGERGESILFAPFKVMLLTSPDILSILFFLIMSILFPLTVTIFWWKSTHNDPSVQLVWMNFAISLLYVFLLTEQTDMASANFAWGAMAGVFLLFVVTAKLYLKEILKGTSIRENINWRSLLAGVLMIVHIVCGVYFVFSSTISTALVP